MSSLARFVLSMVLMFSVASVALAQMPEATPDVAESLAPELVISLIVFDPWAMVIGSDSPVFALYDNRQVIYSTGEVIDGQWVYHTAMLDDDEYTALVDDLIPDEFFTLEEYYDLLLMTDQPSNVIRVVRDGEEKQVGVYGDLASDSEARSLAPATYVTLYDALTAYEHPDAETWQPERIEIMLWSWDTSGADAWPEDFPRLNSPYAVERDDQWSIFVTPEQFEVLDVMMQEGGGAIELGGETWAASYRMPFPHEDVWRVMLEQVALEGQG